KHTASPSGFKIISRAHAILEAAAERGDLLADDESGPMSLLWMIKEGSTIAEQLVQSDAEIYHKERDVCPVCLAEYLKIRWRAGDRRPKTDGQWIALAQMTVGVLNWADDSDGLDEAIGPVNQPVLN